MKNSKFFKQIQYPFFVWFNVFLFYFVNTGFDCIIKKLKNIVIVYFLNLLINNKKELVNFVLGLRADMPCVQWHNRA